MLDLLRTPRRQFHAVHVPLGLPVSHRRRSLDVKPASRRQFAPTIARSAPFVLAFCATLTLSLLAADTTLGECSAGADTLQILLRENPDGKRIFALSAGTRTSHQSFNLQTPCPADLNKKLAAPLRIEATDPANPFSVIANFSIDAQSGDAKFVSVWLLKSADRWTLRGEWSVDKFNHKELGEKNETQSFAFQPGNILRRSVSRNNIDGVQTTCPQGCCKIWQTKTLVTEEVETLAWNESERAAERRTFFRTYVAQYGESLLTIATKIYGDPMKISTLYFFNPQLQKQETLNEGQKIIVEKVPR